MTEYPLLARLAGAYFHQDFDLDYGTGSSAVLAFLNALPVRKRVALLDEICAALSENNSESGLEHLWTTELDSYFEPEREGLTYRQWFERMRNLSALGTKSA